MPSLSRIAAVLLLVFAAAAPARARQSGAPPAPAIAFCAPGRCLALPPPADTGKAVIDDLAGRDRDGCADTLPCRLRVIGEVPGRRGAIELRATALTW